MEIIDTILTIPFGPGQSIQRCVTVQVVGDLIREDNEVFNVRITPENSNDIIPVQLFRVVILDDGDSECSYKGNDKGNLLS